MSKQTNREEQAVLDKLAELGGRLTAEEDVVFQGMKLVIPERMTLRDAKRFISEKIEEDERAVSFTRLYKYRPWDGARAVLHAFRKAFGMVTQRATYGIFGQENPPQLITIDTGVEQTEAVPWGAMAIPMLPGATFYLSGDEDPELGVIFQLTVQGPRKYRFEIEGLFRLVEVELETNSLYRGKAFDGQDNPKFLDLRGFDRSKVIYSEEVLTQLDANVWSVLRYSERLRELGLPLKRAVLLEGPYGCLAGGTKIAVNRGGKGYEVKIADLVRRQNGEDARYSWDPAIPTFVQRMSNDGTIRLARLSNAWCSGRKQTYTLRTDTGRTIRATDEHPFSTARGWLRLDQLVPGDRVDVRGAQKGDGSQRERGKRAAYRKLSVGPHHPYGQGNRKSGWHVDEHRLVMEAHENGLSFENYLANVKAGAVDGLKFIDPTEWHVHHRDENTLNNELSNLEKLTHREHHLLHAEAGTPNVLFKTVTELVVSIEPHGEETTYDIEVEGEPHNFVANGFVVHNTGKTLAASWTARVALENGWTFISCRPGRDDFLQVMQTARLYQPAVVFFEDVDSITDPESAERDRVSQLLDVFDGIQAKDTRIVVVLTTNHVERIHKGMVRPGRLDAVIPVGALDALGFERLVKAVVPAGRLGDVDYAKVAEAFEGFMPAFAREAIDRTVRYNVARNRGEATELHTADFVHSAEGLRYQLQLMEGAKETGARFSLDEKLKALVGEKIDGAAFMRDGQVFGELKTTK